MKNNTNDIRDLFSGLFGSRTVILGVGNPLRGDDGFGPAFIAELNGIPGVLCLDAGSAPENYLGKIIKEDPDNVLIVDAAHLEKSPGEYDILRKDEIIRSGFTTHDLSPVMFIEYLEERTRADIIMLAVQPESLEMGAGMSAPVRRTLDDLVKTARESQNA